MRTIKGYGTNNINESYILKKDLEYFNFLYKYNFELYIFYPTLMTKSIFSKELKNSLITVSFQENEYWIYVKYRQSYKVKLLKFTLRDNCTICDDLKELEKVFKEKAFIDIRKEKVLLCLK